MNNEQALDRLRMLRQYALGEDAKALDVVLSGISLPEPKPKKLTKRELVAQLKELKIAANFSSAGIRDAVEVLLRYIGDDKVSDLFWQIERI
jgi:hypothetical protein